MNEAQIDTIARACHEANRAWCLHHGDTSQVAYDDAPEEIKESSRNGVVAALSGGPRESHETWMAGKIKAGWMYGPVKDADAKTHPDIVPYDSLPAVGRAKDAVYIGVVRAFAAAFA